MDFDPIFVITVFVRKGWVISVASLVNYYLRNCLVVYNEKKWNDQPQPQEGKALICVDFHAVLPVESNLW